MIIFAIALRSKASSNNWSNVTNDFNNTIESIFNQTDPNFMVYVGCNEIPELHKKYDDRLKFFTVNNPVPTVWVEAARDKFWKYTLVACQIKKYLLGTEKPEKGIFVMPIDADDLLNSHIAEYVNSHLDSNGFVSDFGYVYYKGNHYVEKYPDMHTFCGSCNIIKMYLNDLPDEMLPQSLCFDKKTAGILNEKYPIRWNHNEVVSKYCNLGKPFEKLPFPSTIYCLNNGENISQWHSRENSSKPTFKKRLRVILSNIKHYSENKKKRIKIDTKITNDFLLKTDNNYLK